jgi:hypothetical protein
MAAGSYEFSVDYFAAHVPAWEQILNLRKPSRIVEVGSYEGRSASFVIDRIAQQRPLELWCIDTWQGSVAPGHDPASMENAQLRFDHNIELAKSRAKFPATVNKMRGRSDDGLARLLADGHRESMDLIYIDGSHEAPDVLTDAAMAFPLLGVGGVMIFDDYTWFLGSQTERDPLQMPKPGIDAFLNLFTRKMCLIYGAPVVQIYAEKTSV